MIKEAFIDHRNIMNEQKKYLNKNENILIRRTQAILGIVPTYYKPDIDIILPCSMWLNVSMYISTKSKYSLCMVSYVIKDAIYKYWEIRKCVISYRTDYMNSFLNVPSDTKVNILMWKEGNLSDSHNSQIKMNYICSIIRPPKMSIKTGRCSAWSKQGSRCKKNTIWKCTFGYLCHIHRRPICFPINKPYIWH